MPNWGLPSGWYLNASTLSNISTATGCNIMWLTQSQCWCCSQPCTWSVVLQREKHCTWPMPPVTWWCLYVRASFFFKFTQLRTAKRGRIPNLLIRGFISSQPSLISRLSDISILSQPLMPHPDPQGLPFGIWQGSVRLWCISKVMSTVTDDWNSWCSVMCEVPKGAEAMGGWEKGDTVTRFSTEPLGVC